MPQTRYELPKLNTPVLAVVEDYQGNQTVAIVLRSAIPEDENIWEWLTFGGGNDVNDIGNYVYDGDIAVIYWQYLPDLLGEEKSCG